jgi:hypothetical protein
MLEKHGELLGGAELKKRAKVDANLFDPSTLFRMERQIERPTGDEGFASIEIVPFVRAPDPSVAAKGMAGVALPIELVLREVNGVPSLRDDAQARVTTVPADVPLLFFGWKPVGVDEAWRAAAAKSIAPLQEIVGALGAARRPIEIAMCTHAGGPPMCWCRPPLPGLWLDFARRHAIDPRLSLFLATTPTQRTMAKSLGIKTITIDGRLE